MSTDQYTFDNPSERYPAIFPPMQQQPEPGVGGEMTPRPDLDEQNYRGTGMAS